MAKKRAPPGAGKRRRPQRPPGGSPTGSRSGAGRRRRRCHWWRGWAPRPVASRRFPSCSARLPPEPGPGPGLRPAPVAHAPERAAPAAGQQHPAAGRGDQRRRRRPAEPCLRDPGQHAAAPAGRRLAAGAAAHRSEPVQPHRRLLPLAGRKRRERAPSASCCRATPRTAWPGCARSASAGGTVLVQDPQTARFDPMPRAAIDAERRGPGAAPGRDRAGPGPPGGRSRGPPAADGRRRSARATRSSRRIFGILRTATGVDFSHYKQPTIRRRLQRRMVLLKLADLEAYLRYLESTPGEVRSLYDDLLIQVTRFFRDPETFEALAERVFPAIAEGRSPDSPIRIWVPGCATGEEAYSIAMTLLEHLGDAAAGTRSRSSPPTSATRPSTGRGPASTRRPSPRTSRPAGCGASSPRSTAATRSPRRCATCASSPART